MEGIAWQKPHRRTRGPGTTVPIKTESKDEKRKINPDQYIKDYGARIFKLSQNKMTLIQFKNSGF